MTQAPPFETPLHQVLTTKPSQGSYSPPSQPRSLLPASLCLRINAAVTAAEKSPERRLTPGAVRAGLAMGGWGCCRAGLTRLIALQSASSRGRPGLNTPIPRRGSGSRVRNLPCSHGPQSNSWEEFGGPDRVSFSFSLPSLVALRDPKEQAAILWSLPSPCSNLA